MPGLLLYERDISNAVTAHTQRIKDFSEKLIFITGNLHQRICDGGTVL